MPLQVICYERADDHRCRRQRRCHARQGHSRQLSRPQPGRDSHGRRGHAGARALSARPHRRQPPLLASARSQISFFAPRRECSGVEDDAFELPWTPAFLHKHGGLVLSIGQFNQWVGSQLMASGLVQIWPGTPVSRTTRLPDDAVDRPAPRRPGRGQARRARRRLHARHGCSRALTVVGDGPVGAVGQALDQQLRPARRTRAARLGAGHEVRHRAARRSPRSKPGTVWHTFGYPEPEIFGFLYVHPDRLVSVGIFVPSWMSDPSRTAYRYLQHYIQHPALWQHLEGRHAALLGRKVA